MTKKERSEAECWAILGISLEKARRYIKDPSKAPEGVTVQRGKRGGYFYETAGTAKPKKPRAPRKKRLSTGGFASLMRESPKFNSRRDFMRAVNKAWDTGDLIDVGDERGVKFGDMVLSLEVMEQLTYAKHPYNSLLRYGSKE